MGIRLVRYLAQCGAASRRGAADLVREGVVAVNGNVTDNVALAIEPGDRVTVHGETVRPPRRHTVAMVNKPAGVVCTRRDPHNPRTILDLVPPRLREILKPIGRLDKDTTGLILLTDDGDLAFRLTHPRFGIEKTYMVEVEGRVATESLRALSEGVQLDDGWTSEAKVRVLGSSAPRAAARTTTAPKTTLEIRIHEGRKRQVRRMCEKVGHRVARLERVGFGPLALGGLRVGEWRELSADEIASLTTEPGMR